MVPLQTNKEILMLVSIYPAEPESTNKWKRIARILFPMLCLAVGIFSIAAHIAFIFAYISTNLTDCLFAFMLVSSLLDPVYTMLIGYINRQKIFSIFEDLSKIYEASKL